MLLTYHSDGNDGTWSSLALQVGTPAQDVKVLVATSGQETWVVAPEGCIASDPPDYPKNRGYIFNRNASTRWNLMVLYSLFQGEEGANFNFTGDNARYGFDNVDLD